jgi:hypothetical protein
MNYAVPISLQTLGITKYLKERGTYLNVLLYRKFATALPLI